MKGPSAQYTGMIVDSDHWLEECYSHKSLTSHNDTCEIKHPLPAAQLMEKWLKKCRG